MKGNAKVIKELNAALCTELTAINQYFINSKMCANWGYEKLAKHFREESIEEMQHADILIDRILFLDGMPNMQKYHPILVGETVKEQIENDLGIELDAVAHLNKAVKIARDAGDNGSRELFEKILKDEEKHVDHLEAQLNLIREVGLKNYLMQQM